MTVNGERLTMTKGETELEMIPYVEGGELVIVWQKHREGLGNAVEITTGVPHISCLPFQNFCHLLPSKLPQPLVQQSPDYPGQSWPFGALKYASPGPLAASASSTCTCKLHGSLWGLHIDLDRASVGAGVLGVVPFVPLCLPPTF